MNQIALEFFAFIGAGTITILLIVLLGYIYAVLKEKMDYWRRKRKDRHRFEGKPTGKCYCIQCDHWHAHDTGRDTGLCMVWEKWTSDAETCKRGTLRTEQGYKDESWRIEKT